MRSVHWLQYGNFDVYFINKTAMGKITIANMQRAWLGLYASLSTTRRNHATIKHAISLLNSKHYTDVCSSHLQMTTYKEVVLIISDQFELETHFKVNPI